MEPTGKVFTQIGYTWRPTGRTFTIVGNACPLTRITTTNEVPSRKPVVLDSESPKPVVKLVYSRKPRKNKNAESVSKTKALDSGLEAHDPEIAPQLTISSVNSWRTRAIIYVSCGQFCDSNLEVAFRQHTCFIRNLEGVDLLTGSRGDNLYTLSLGNMMASSPICLLSKASKTKSWLWHRRLSHLNFGSINHLARHGLVRGLPKLKFEKDHLCSACALGKSSKKPHKPKSEDTNQEKLYLLHMDLCGPMRVASVSGKKYILVIVDDYSRFTWETVRRIRTDNGTEFVNQTLREYYEKVGISHETSVARSPQQNGVVERRNRTLIEAARTMLKLAKALYYYGARSHAEELHEFETSGGLELVPPPNKALSSSLNGSIRKVYVSQPDGFVDPDKPNHVYKLKKALYGLKQAPRAWYDMLSSFLISNDFSKGSVDPTLFIRREGQRSNSVDTPMVEKSKLDEDKEGEPLLDHHIICTTSPLDGGSQLTDYGFGFNKIPMYCDNKTQIAIMLQQCSTFQIKAYRHPVSFHQSMLERCDRTFIVHTRNQLAEISLKLFGRERIEFLINKLGMRSFTPDTLKQLADEVDE
ncbi:retrovirus-related pol polyprotein from transposon TNT 1-94 [Tanacetum coccineum]